MTVQATRATHAAQATGARRRATGGRAAGSRPVQPRHPDQPAEPAGPGRVAGLDRRFHAFAIDALAGAAVCAAGGYPAYLLVAGGRTAAGVAVALGVLVLLGVGLAVLTGLRGVSPGKAALGLRVVRPGTGQPIGVPAALARVLVLALAGPPTFGLGVATLAWTAVADRTGRRRGWHDHLVGSLVVDARPAPPADADEVPAPRPLVNLTALRLGPPPAVSSPPVGPPAGEPAEEPVAPGVVAGWRVSFDSGESLLVEGLTLVGRRPEPREGEPVRHLVPLRSEDMSVSKTHAQFQVVPDGALVVMDRVSTNGTFLVRRGAARQLPPDRPATLLDGDVVRFGDRTMTVAREE